INVYGEPRFFKFTASGGDGVYISIDKKSASSFGQWVQFRLYRPAQKPGKQFYEFRESDSILTGNVYVTHNDPNHLTHWGMKLPGSGAPETYLIMIRADGAVSDSTGSFTLSVDTAPAGDT